MKKVCNAMAVFAASLQTANDKWNKGLVSKAMYDDLLKTVNENGGVDGLLMLLAVVITKPEDSDEEYPTINFLIHKGK